MIVKDTMDNFLKADVNFNMRRLSASVWDSIEATICNTETVSKIKSILKDDYTKLSNSILRNVFLIELVKIPAIETTKFRVRWFDQLDGDPRFCSFEECIEIAHMLLTSLPGWLEEKKNSSSLYLSFNFGLIPYEIPLDYVQRFTTNGCIHQLDNLTWFSDELSLRSLFLRKYLLDPATSPDASFFRMVLTDKIKVKTYLTDRVLTGTYKTNREKRWETHPNSVHFAVRRVCNAIEYTLVTQLCAFEGFPKESFKNLQDANILPINLPLAICPITGDTLSYNNFREELMNPTHGKSDFQVGHINPLKLNLQDASEGHTSENISWISADGNRIQGSLSLQDVRLLIKRIAKNVEIHKW